MDTITENNRTAIFMTSLNNQGGYFKMFFEKYYSFFSSVLILNIGTEWSDLNRDIDPVSAECLSVPMPFGKYKMADFTNEELLKYGWRIIDLLILEKEQLEKDQDITFFFHNCNDAYLIPLLKQVFPQARFIVFVDYLAGEKKIAAAGDIQSGYTDKSQHEELMFTQTDQIICFSNQLKEIIEISKHDSKEKISVWKYEGISIQDERFSQGAVSRLKKDYLLDNVEKLVLFDAKNTSEEEILFVITALNEFLKDQKTAKVIITGNLSTDLLNQISNQSWYQFSLTGLMADKSYLDLVLIADLIIALHQEDFKDHLLTDVLCCGTPLITKRVLIPGHLHKHAGLKFIPENSRVEELNRLIHEFLAPGREKQSSFRIKTDDEVNNQNNLFELLAKSYE